MTVVSRSGGLGVIGPAGSLPRCDCSSDRGGWLVLLVAALVGVALAALAVPAPPVQAASSTYYLVGVSPAQSLPDGSQTNSQTGVAVTDAGTDSVIGRTLLGSAGTGSAVGWRFDQSAAGEVLLGWAAAPNAYSRPTTVAAGVTATVGLTSSGGTWRFELIDMDAAGVVATSTLGTASTSQTTAGTNPESVGLTFDNKEKTLAAGHRIGVRVWVTAPTGATHQLHFNGPTTGASFSRLVATEIPVPPDPPTTSISTSPPAPDGDADWFKSPVTITLTASDPAGLGVTSQYDWNTNPPASSYLGNFPALSGQNTLYYRSVNTNGDQETVQRQLFKVDTSVTPPDMVAPAGDAASPLPVTGTVKLRAAGSDAVSGVNYMAFYSFAWNGTDYDAVGAQMGENQTVPVGTDTYELAWNTLLVADGGYMLQSQMRDVAGNTALSKAQYVLVDNSAPTATLADPAPGANIRGNAYTVKGTVQDANLRSWTLDIRREGSGSFTTLVRGTSPVADGTLTTLDTTTYPPGRYELRLTATDAAGNATVDSHASVTLDNAPPSVSGATAGDATRVDVFFSEGVTAKSVTAALFTIPGLTVSGATLQPDAHTVRLTTSAQTAGQEYSVDVRRTPPTIADLAGNELGTPSSTTFKGFDKAADVTPPAVPGGLQAVSGDGKNDLSWNAGTEADLDGYNVYRDTSPQGAFATKVNQSPVRSTVTFTDTSYGASGVYYYKVTAVDVAGNQSAKSTAAAAEKVDIRANVSAAGDTLASSTGDVRVAIPADALPGSSAVEIVEKAKPADTPALTFASLGYDFLPTGQSFSSEVAITVVYDPKGVDESALKLVYSEAGGPWIQAEGGSTVDKAAKTVTGKVKHFSEFAVAMTDVTTPTVEAVTPANGATDVPVAGYVTIVFGEPMDPATLSDANLQLKQGTTVVPSQAVVYESDPRTAYLYPKQMLKLSTAYSVVVAAGVKDVAGNPLGADATTSFTTAAVAVTPHESYSTATNLCRNCHVVHGAAGPKLFTSASEKEVCYTCHDGTGSAYNVRTADTLSPYTWDFGEEVLNNTSDLSYHPVPKPTSLGTGVTMQCSNCHNAHAVKGSGPAYLAVKKLDPGYGGGYGPVTGNAFCFTCHNTTASASGGYISAASWNASTGFDHKTYFPPAGVSHNNPAGVGFTAGDQKVPTQANIICKACHSEHGTANTKLIAQAVNNVAITFDTRTVGAYNLTYNTLCNACHVNAGIGGFEWAGAASYAGSGHGSSTAAASLLYAPPVPAVDQGLQVNVCKQCHEPHGAGDANGTYPNADRAYLNLTRDFEQTLCFRCHNGTAAKPVGAADLVTPFGRAYRHELELSNLANRTHDLDAEYAATLNPNPRLSGTNRHVECTDCHNSHAAKNAAHIQGNNTVSGMMQGVWGVAATTAAGAFSEPSTWQWTKVNPSLYTYQICFKCHSAAAFGATPPARTANTTRGTSYWPTNTATDQAKEFNPENGSYHAVWGASKASGRGTYLNGWNAAKQMDCADCHKSDVAGDPLGTHGSGTPFMLGGYGTPASSRYVTGPNGGDGYGDSVAARDADFTFCYGCHDKDFGGTGFAKGSDNLHTKDVHAARACTNCHAAVPHGVSRPRLLVTASDPAPYNDHAGQNYGIVSINVDPTLQTGNWDKKEYCSTAGPCH